MENTKSDNYEFLCELKSPLLAEKPSGVQFNSAILGGQVYHRLISDTLDNDAPLIDFHLKSIAALFSENPTEHDQIREIAHRIGELVELTLDLPSGRRFRVLEIKQNQTALWKITQTI